jgi:hypothetical protein
MIERKRKLKIIQFSLLLIASIIIYFTYSNKNTDNLKENLNTINEENKNFNSTELNENENIFFNIEYSGIDLSGNRYILRSEEAKNNKLDQEIIQMKNVTAFFYFKDDTILEIRSKFGVYNNKTLDMKFSKDLVANYDNSVLNANEAVYLNSNGSLKISGNVKLIDSRGKLDADELLFDLKEQSINIASKKGNYVNTKIDLNEKKF